MSSPVTPQSVRDLLLRADMAPREVESAWRALGHEDWQRADGSLQRMAGEPPVRLALAEIAPELLDAVRASADPAMALHNFERFVDAVQSPLMLFGYLRDDPSTLTELTTLFAGSQFLSDVLRRNPEYLEVLTELGTPPDSGPTDFGSRVERTLRGLSTVEARVDALRRFQRLELLRTGAADLLGLLEFPAVVDRLSALADALIECCLSLAAKQSGGQLGLRDRGVFVAALGKLGGHELNYSSDVDLLLARAETCPEPVAHRVTELMVRYLAEATQEGYLYRVDLRLRPYGSVGPLVPSLPSFLEYLRRRAKPWERQACLKLRPLAGAVSLGEEFLRALDPLVFVERREGSVRREIREMKDRIESGLVKRRDEANVKLGIGGIRDIEFIAQCLQLENGPRHPEVRQRSTLAALEALRRINALPEETCERLRSAYVFLRTVEHRLQMHEARQVHSLPRERLERRRLALRCGLTGNGSAPEDEFDRVYRQHTGAVREVFERLLPAA